MKVYNKIFKRDCYSFGIIDEPIYACINPGWKPIVIWYNVKLKSGTFLADPFGVEINCPPPCSRLCTWASLFDVLTAVTDE